ncbi:GAF domain-containing protein [Thiorhodococcus mannitoliphagus]|uniref:GAF domain-containing protein n=1 Tax=Thiorhodococcus mannitoliphagus TaxID=329406 RepID=A0A6P1DLJ7_9GAMM|nr:GAF domain-containing protein [Thiorhodococcus mannitoliphagus]NEX18908.1 GAF domain-containing protein [Thiorhodococcus mannitoliphagus]
MRQRGRYDSTIQSCAALLVVREADLTVTHASDNAALFLGVAEDLIGCGLAELGRDLHDRVRAHLDHALDGAPVVLRCPVGEACRECDLLLHRPSSGGLVIELEPAGPAVDLSVQIERALDPLLSADSVERLCDASAGVFQELTGYDRVLVFRFDEAGYGQVVSEQRKAGVASCLGQHFGDSEAPPNAHSLIERNRMRHLVDAHEPPVFVRPLGNAQSGLDLDLSRCTWRSLSPLHLQFLEQLDVRGTLVAPLSVGARLWGLVVCHHRTPRFVHYPARAACELLAETAATRIAALEATAERVAEARVRGLESRLIEAISRHGDWRPALMDDASLLLGLVEAAGVALTYEGQVTAFGETPSEGRLREILAWLDARTPKGVVAASVVGHERRPRTFIGPSAYALLAAPLSRADGEYLLWFRAAAKEELGLHPEPALSAVVSRHPSQWLGHGFAGSAMLTTGRLPRWSSLDRITARLLGDSIGDVIQQFRSVRVLIAQAQLAQAKSELDLASQPILIADAQGGVLCTTPAWDATPGFVGQGLAAIQDLASLCMESSDVEQHLRDLLAQHRAWRGRIRLRGDNGKIDAYLIRADAIFSAPGQVIGLVVILTRTFEQDKAPQAERARVAPEGVAAASAGVSGPYSGIASLMTDNRKQVARALSQGGDCAQGSPRCDGAERAAARALELLGRLIAYGRTESRSGFDAND